MGSTESETFRTMTIQDTGGTKKTVEAGVEAVKAMLPSVNRAKRETAPASELMLALQCGGSDGYSGITANPALGVGGRYPRAHGGTAILSETPEIYGAEHLLTRRAQDARGRREAVEHHPLVGRLYARNNMEMNNNPSPGNKLGGLTTILEKSLGAAAKGGTTPLNAVYHYADPVTEKGFVFMDTPGYDPVSATGQVAGGANILCFTTGRGSAYGCKPTPSIKLATNTTSTRQMIDDMDINCGDVLDGVSLEQKGQEIFDKILASPRAKRASRKKLGYGDNEFVPWQIGAFGAAFLETSANPYIAILGDPATSSVRLNFAQAFNGVATVLGPLVGGYVIFSGVEYTPEQIAAMSPQAVDAWRASEAATVGPPYMVLGVLMVLIIIAIALTKYPALPKAVQPQGSGSIFAVLKKQRVRHAVVAQFFYCGAQVGIWSLLVDFCKEAANVPARTGATVFLFSTMVAFCIGRFFGAWLQRHIDPARLLVIYAACNIALCIGAATLGGYPSIIAMVATSFSCRSCFPPSSRWGSRNWAMKPSLRRPSS
jgi:altronate dehydratase